MSGMTAHAPRAAGKKGKEGKGRLIDIARPNAIVIADQVKLGGKNAVLKPHSFGWAR